MGKKTDKKIKSERINALRKQYDSFLEEDKKRKERNDYILGRLDKMRHSNMAVQLHQTPTTYRDFLPSSFSHHSSHAEKLEPTAVDRENTMQMVHAHQQISRPGFQSSQLNVPRNYFDQASILNEITKNYILIPKLKTAFPNTSVEAITSPNAELRSSVMIDIDSNDWKSKYDILKQLKCEEKEEIPKCASQEHASQLDKDHVTEHYNHEDINTNYENEKPVKDISNQLVIQLDLKENCVSSEKHDQIQCSDGDGELNANSLANISYQNVNDLGEKIEHGLHVAEYAVAQEQNEKRGTEGVLNNVKDVNYQNFNPEEEYDQEASSFGNTILYTNPNPEQDQIQEVLTNNDSVENQKTYPNQELVPDVSNNQNTVQYQNSHPDEEYPIEYEQFIPEQVTNINRTEQLKALETNNADSAKKPTYSPDESVILEYDRLPTSATRIISPTVTDTGDVNTEAENTTDNSEAFTAGIEEFDAEQRELFHTQNTNEDYSYYGQDGTYNTEYSQQQNYPQSQEYAYYEGTEQEVQPVEVNEYEETQQQYDPAYEQKYMSTYDQTQEEEQQSVYPTEPNTQPLPEPNYDLNQIQDLEDLSYGPQDTVMNVEKVLVKEEGLTDLGAEEEHVVLTEM